MRRTILALLSALLALAGCGGHAPRRTPPPQLPLLAGHRCDPADYTMGCALKRPGLGAVRSAQALAYGLDFGWGQLSAARARGYQFAASYLSHDPAKDWTRSQIDAFHRAGLATVAVWETSAERAAQGCAAGRADALEASARLRALGAPAGQAFDMAIDFDATGQQVDGYFRCAHQTVGDRESAYGGYRPLAYLCARGLVGHRSWQTYAWSGGLWLPGSCAPLEQYLNGALWDYDRAIAPDYGQWPYAAARPAAVKVHCFGRSAHARARRCQAPRRAVGARNAEIRRVRAALGRYRCRDGHPGAYRPGPNHDRDFCTRLFRIGSADHRHVDAALRRVY